jgi:hypothetical protein
MNEQPQTNMRIIMIVVITLALNATVGLSTLAYCLVFKIEPNQVLLTAYLSIVTGLLGLIGGMLTKTSPTETTKVPPPVPPTNGITVGGPPAKVEVVNTPAAPVQTEEVK